MDIEEFLNRFNASAPEQKLGRNSIRHINRYDRQDIDHIRQEIARYDAARDHLEQVATDTGGTLGDDATMAIYKIDPELADALEVEPAWRLNRAVMEEMMATPEYQRLHSYTEGDLVMSAMAFCDFEPKLEELYDRRANPFQEKVDTIEAIGDGLAGAGEAAADLGGLIAGWSAAGDAEAAQNGQDALDDVQGQIGSLQEALAAAEAALDAEAKEAARSGMVDLRAAMAETADQMEQLDSMARGFGLEPGEVKRMPASQRVELAARFNDNEKFKLLAQLIGPMMRLASAEQKRKVIHGFEDIIDVELGNDLAKVTPSELMLINHPLTRPLFWKGFLEQSLLQYRTRATEKIGKGGIIFALDCSGTMEGQREIWGKATGLAMYAIAKAQKRSFYGIHFSSRTQLKTFDFRDHSKVGFEDLIEYAEHFFDGGTDFMVPLSAALKLLQDEFKEKGFVEGDIVFVTDGECRVSDEWLAEFNSERERLGFKVWGIAIGAVKKEPLHSICAGDVVTIGDLLSGEEIRRMFRDV